MDRRTFIRTGVFGGTALALAGYMTKDTFWGKGSQNAVRGDYHYHFLTETDRVMLGALIAVILDGALTEKQDLRAEQTELVCRNLDNAVASFLPGVQAEVRQLFSLMTLAPTRKMVIGVWAPWEKAAIEDISAFLDRWRFSSIALFQSGYDALTQLIMGSFYGTSHGWEVAGYPGPPALNQAGGAP